MSAESVQAYVNWIKQSDGINSQASRQLNSITSQLNALNPGNPNSTAQLAALQKQAQAVVNSRDSQLAALGRPPNPANFTEKELAQVGAQIGLNAGNGLLDYQGALGSLQSAGAAAQKNIGTTQSAGTSRGQTSPVTTGDGTSKPVTNVAASANTTTKTSVTSTSNTTQPPPTSTPILKTKPEPIAVTPNVDPITGRTEPIAVTSGDPALAIIDEPLITGNIISDEELAALTAQSAADIDAAVIAFAAEQDQFIFQGRKDWRVRLSLSDAPEVNYLYRAPNPGILNPLNATNGVLFPYTPTISVNYSANYNPTDLVHSNYKVYQYSSSSIDSINISCDFTAQDTYEANYLLAVIHFFRSATKMFYGQDENPRRGTPPPLCYIYGMGSYQFAGQPLAITQFSYNLPNSVDYIKTSVGGNTASATTQPSRMAGTGASKGGVLPPPNFTPTVEPDTISWVPSKIQLSITCVPMLSRNQVSNRFSLEKYATGELLNGIGKPGGGFW